MDATNNFLSTADLVLQKLGKYELHQESANQYRCNSPLRASSDSQSFALTIKDGEHGAFCDHVTGESGSLYELAEKLEIKREVQSSKRAYKNFEDYAEHKGVPASVFSNAGWFATTHHNRPAIEFPTNTGPRYRFLDGNNPPFINVKGYERCWYRLDSALEKIKTTEQPLVICNGEPSTVVAQHFGVAAVCVTAGERGKIPDNLIKELKEKYSSKIFIVFDCDDTGRKSSIALTKHLRQLEYEVKAIDLSSKHKGYDLADFCKQHGDKTIEELQRLPELFEELPLFNQPIDQSKPSNYYNKIRQIDPDDLDIALLFKQRYGSDVTLDRQSRVWFAWTGTHFADCSKDGNEITRLITKTIRECTDKKVTASKIASIRTIAESQCDELIFEQKPNLINFQNGTLDLQTMKLKEHDRKDCLTYCFSYDYQPGEHKKIDEFLEQTFPDDRARYCFCALIGLAMMGDTRMHYCGLIKGKPRSGKSTSLAIGNAMLDKPSFSFAGPSLFDRSVEGKRARAEWNKHGLVCIDELPIEALRNEETFKAMTAHSGTDARKMFKDEEVDNKWLPKLLFSTNEYPHFKDTTGAMLERLLILLAPNYREENQRDLVLIDNLLTERSSFADTCIKRAQDVLAHGYFPKSRAMKQALIEIANNGNPLKEFISDECILQVGAWESTQSLYERYKVFCFESGYHAMGRSKFSSAICEMNLNVSSLRKRYQGTVVRGLVGIRLKTSSDVATETMDCVDAVNGLLTREIESRSHFNSLFDNNLATM